MNLWSLIEYLILLAWAAARCTGSRAPAGSPASTSSVSGLGLGVEADVIVTCKLLKQLS